MGFPTISCQNGTLFEITCHGSFILLSQRSILLIYSMCTGDMTLLTLTFRRHNQITQTEVIQEHVNTNQNQAQPTGSPAREHVVNSMLFFF